MPLKAISTSLLLAAFILPSAVASLGKKDAKQDAKIDVMTTNIYLGASLGGLFDAVGGGPQALNQAVLDALAFLQRTNFRERAKSIAMIVSERHPDVIGVTEASSVGCFDSGNNACELNDDIAGAFVGDYVDVLLEELHHLGTPYSVVARSVNTDFSAVISTDGTFSETSLARVQSLDQDIVLVKKDFDATAQVVDFGCPVDRRVGDGCKFSTLIPTGFSDPLPEEIIRSVSLVDLTVRGKDYRIALSHLERSPVVVDTPIVFQSSQAVELGKILINTTPPGKELILLIDSNSDPTDGADNHPAFTLPCPAQICGEEIDLPTPYFVLTMQFGFTDAWTFKKLGTHSKKGSKKKKGKGQKFGKHRDLGGKKTKKKKGKGGNINMGFTWGQDADLLNDESFPTFQRRIDQIFVLGGDNLKTTKNVEVLGEDQSDRTESGLWPSDHGFVAATLVFKH